MGEGLKKIYKAKLLPLEEAYEFHEFISPPLNEPDFDAKPMIMFVGQYSTGKNQWISGLLTRLDFLCTFNSLISEHVRLFFPQKKIQACFLFITYS